jgi:hypothetical protein
LLSLQAYLGGEAMKIGEQAHTIGLPLEATMRAVKGLFVGLLSEHPAIIVKVQSIADNHASLVKVSPMNPGLSVVDAKSLLAAITPNADMSCGLPRCRASFLERCAQRRCRPIEVPHRSLFQKSPVVHIGSGWM